MKAESSMGGRTPVGMVVILYESDSKLQYYKYIIHYIEDNSFIKDVMESFLPL